MKPRYWLAAAVSAVVFPIHLLLLSSGNDNFYTHYGLAVIGLLAIGVYISRRAGMWTFAAFFIVAMCLQNLYLGFLLNYQKSPELFPTLVLIETKTVLLFGGAGLLLLMSWRLWIGCQWDLGTYGLIVFGLVVGISFWLSSAPLFAKAGYIRNFFAPVAAWYLGKLCVRKYEDFSSSIGLLFAVGILISVFSLFELMNHGFWAKYLQQDALMDLKGPTADYTDFLGMMLPRLYSGIGSPINAAYVFSMLFLLTLFAKRRALTVIFGVQALLTFAKAGMMVGIAGLVLFLMRRRLEQAKNWMRVLWVAPVILLLILAYLQASGSGIADATDIYATEQELDSTAAGHLRGLVGGIVHVPEAPFGHGLGVSGNMALVGQVIGVMDTEDADMQHRLELGSENAVGTILYQLGVLGLLSFGTWAVYRAKELFRIFQQLRNESPIYSSLALAATGGLLGILLSSFGSESTMVPQNGGLVFLVGGLVAGAHSIMQKRLASDGYPDVRATQTL
ncbi:MAG: hypothetical protein JO356_04305 [Acidobacteria bacterium]|nr:hypothetical protein [Acidobacteriota bacterium]